jgi:gamma-glutamylcyclotransferase (GGCT)/AIG2-like uncharacterized protein YtfP
MKQYLFSYGTLVPGRAPAEIAPTVRKLRPIGPGKVRGRLYDLGNYPGAVLNKTASIISGEVFELPESPNILVKLDEYEGFDPANPQGSLFVRKRRLVSLNGGKKKWCWIYVYNRPLGHAPTLHNGDFSKSRRHASR